jgi:SAM-dependent methyltransferase
MEFTGERYVPGAAGQEELYIEHMSRYRFATGLAAGRRVLDVGSGCGYGTCHLAAGGAELTLGIDISSEAVAFARRNYRHPGLCFAVMDASRLSLGGRFHLVTCFELIEHVEDARAVLRGVDRVLDDSGVFVVSTPNKATYVAGGEDGKNPFHVREYYREEFEGLLEDVFPAVRVLGQHWIEGMALGPHPALAGCGEVRAGRLPEDRGPSLSHLTDSGASSGCNADYAADSEAHPTCAGSGEPPYFIAICAKHDVLDDAIASLSPVAFYGRAVRYDSLKEAARRLEREFDRRGEWAQGLDREIHVKDMTIRSLQRELAELRNRFGERGRWAERLNGELRQSGALVERLAEENRHLRESLAARRQAGWSKVTQ